MMRVGLCGFRQAEGGRISGQLGRVTATGVGWPMWYCALPGSPAAGRGFRRPDLVADVPVLKKARVIVTLVASNSYYLLKRDDETTRTGDNLNQANRNEPNP
jgi:hypothetical protein